MIDFNELQGQVIEFNSKAEDFEMDFDAGMKARVVSVEHDVDTVFKLVCDFSEFEAVNKPLAKHNYYDTEGNPTLAWHQTKGYPTDKKTSIYVDESETWGEQPFKAWGNKYPTTDRALDALDLVAGPFGVGR